MIHRLLQVALTGAALLWVPAASLAVVVVNDTWKDGTDRDPAPGDADYDDTNGVDGTDFLIWQRNVGLAGTGTPTNGDANLDTNVNATDEDILEDQFGTQALPTNQWFSENGVDVDGDGDVESAWFQGGVGELNPAGPNGPLVATTGAGSSSWTTYFKPPGQKVILSAPGNQLKVTWTFSLTNVNAMNTSQNFRFGVVDSGTRTLENDSPPMGLYAGYAIWGNMGQTFNATNSFPLRERTLLTEGNLFNSSGDFNDTLINGATTGQTGYAASTTYTMTWLMTRGASDNLLLDVSIEGGSLGNDMTETDGKIQAIFDDPTPNTFQFDTFALRPTNETTTATSFRTSSFKVETLQVPVAAAVPEPSALSSGVAIFAAVLARSRRRWALAPR